MRKKMLIIGIISSALVLTIAVIILALPAIAILGEPWFVRFDIQNPHVNRGFRHWQQVQIEDYKPFSIPEGWTVEEETGLYKILDESNEVWAYGAAFGSNNTPFQNSKEMIAAIYNIPIIDTQSIQMKEFLGVEGSYIYMKQVYGEDSDFLISCIYFYVNQDEELIWIVMSDLSVDETQYAIAEAILFSYAFG